jgi:hypothetical protein
MSTGAVTATDVDYTQGGVRDMTLDTAGRLRVNIGTSISLAGTVTVIGEGAAGTPAGGVLTVQGAPGATPIPITPATSVPTAPTASAIAVGGAATTLATGPWQGGFVQNPLTAGDQNIAAAEVVYLNLVTAATAVGRGTNIALQPGDSFILPPVGAGVNLSAIAATTGHALSVELFV